MGFCNNCIKRHFSAEFLKSVIEADEWECIACNGVAIRDMQARHWALLNCIKKKELETAISQNNRLTASRSATQIKSQSPSNQPVAQLSARKRLNDDPLPANLRPAKRAQITQTRSESGLNKYQSTVAQPQQTLISSYNFRTGDEQVFVTGTLYPDTPQGNSKKDLEGMFTAILNLSQTAVNKLRPIVNSISFKKSSTDREIENELERLKAIVALTAENLQKIQASIATQSKNLLERRSQLESGEAPMFVNATLDTVELSSDDDDE